MALVEVSVDTKIYDPSPAAGGGGPRRLLSAKLTATGGDAAAQLVDGTTAGGTVRYTLRAKAEDNHSHQFQWDAWFHKGIFVHFLAGAGEVAVEYGS